MAFAPLSATLTVTVYSSVVPSAAVTVHCRALPKSCGTALPGLTLAPVCVMVGANALRSVPYGTISAIVVPEIAPDTPEITKSVMSFAPLSATVTVTREFFERARVLAHDAGVMHGAFRVLAAQRY